jgi:cytochrome c biogenesis protein CcdA
LNYVHKNAAGHDDVQGLREFPLRKRIIWALLAIVVGVVIAGFWNYKLVDGFGRDVVVHGILGESKGVSYQSQGLEFGFLFAAAAGLASTFTACNCVVFSMLPGLACRKDGTMSRRNVFLSLLFFVTGVTAVCAVYGIYVMSIGSDGLQSFNASSTRLQQAEVTFSILGIFLMLWSAVSYGFLNKLIYRIPVSLRHFFASPRFQASAMGIMAGFFTVGRPFPVFREFLTFAVSSESYWFGALAMVVQGLFQVAVMLILYLLLFRLMNKRITKWINRKPHQLPLISNFTLMLGGAYLLFYWGFAMAYNVGRWGFKLGWY